MSRGDPWLRPVGSKDGGEPRSDGGRGDASKEPGVSSVVATFHARLPGFERSPLRACPSLARRCGVADFRVKDETSRAGLPAFKVLGASWAVYQRLARELGWGDSADVGLGRWRELGELASLADASLPVALVAATDGNHGRAVARLARWLGRSADIYVPDSCPAGRAGLIEREGAAVHRVAGSYQRAVEAALEAAAPSDRWLVQDVARDAADVEVDAIVNGYSTMFEEVSEQWPEGPDVVFVPVGVGSLATAALRARDRRWPHAKLVTVEPARADALRRSLHAGALRTIDDPHRTVMTTLACDAVCPRAWPLLCEGVDAAVAVEDHEALAAVDALAEDGQDSAAGGAAATAGALRLGEDPDLRGALGWGLETRVLALVTEGSAAAG